MTIALGFNCSDGVVLCSDTEMSSGDSLKFKKAKIFRLSPDANWEGDEWTVISAYAGYDLISERIRNLISERIESFSKSSELRRNIRAAIEGVLTEEYKNHRRDMDWLQMLFAISIRGEDHLLLRSHGKIVSETVAAEYMGTGDSSIVRLLSDILCPRPKYLSCQQALSIALYIVSKAKNYVGKCGQDTNAVVVTNGVPFPFSGKYIQEREEQFNQIDSALMGLLPNLLHTLTEREDRNAAIDRFSETVKKLPIYSEFMT